VQSTTTTSNAIIFIVSIRSKVDHSNVGYRVDDRKLFAENGFKVGFPLFLESDANSQRINFY